MEEYYEVTSEIDAREILRYLNNLGIHNINGEILKHFITDLKKLIKYDLQRKHKNSNEELYDFDLSWPERLHSASTFSSRTRSKSQSGVVACNKVCIQKKRPDVIQVIKSVPNLQPLSVQEKALRRACSCVRVEEDPDLPTAKQSKVSMASSNNLIKVPKQAVKKKCDPVALYQFYSSLWKKYRTNVPGENKWADLRWSIRQKMAGCAPTNPVIKMKPPVPDKAKEENR